MPCEVYVAGDVYVLRATSNCDGKRAITTSARELARVVQSSAVGGANGKVWEFHVCPHVSIFLQVAHVRFESGHWTPRRK